MVWKPMKEAPFDEYIMVRNREFGPYEYRVSDLQWIDPAPEEFVTMAEYRDMVKVDALRILEDGK